MHRDRMSSEAVVEIERWVDAVSRADSAPGQALRAIAHLLHHMELGTVRRTPDHLLAIGIAILDVNSALQRLPVGTEQDLAGLNVLSWVAQVHRIVTQWLRQGTGLETWSALATQQWAHVLNRMARALDAQTSHHRTMARHFDAIVCVLKQQFSRLRLYDELDAPADACASASASAASSSTPAPKSRSGAGVLRQLVRTR